MGRILVTGGAGFIGSAVIRQVLAETDHAVINLDVLTYAANRESIPDAGRHPRYAFEPVDICDAAGLRRVFETYRPDAVLHLAAESHVDRSIDGPEAFIQTNVTGTFRLLEAARHHWAALPAAARARFRFHHVSTDEVFGSHEAPATCTEDAPYHPNSPYAASKAGSDHLVRAWYATYGLPVVLTSGSNTYGPYQFPEKLLPLMMLKGLAGEPMPVYGTGDNVRDWLYVEDHARALRRVLERGQVGQRYNIGGGSPCTNLALVRLLCRRLDTVHPEGCPHDRLITFVPDRPGHDRRYALDCGKIARELDWRAQESLESGVQKTVAWYLANRSWWQAILDRRYRGERLGLASGTAGAS